MPPPRRSGRLRTGTASRRRCGRSASGYRRPAWRRRRRRSAQPGESAMTCAEAWTRRSGSRRDRVSRHRPAVVHPRRTGTGIAHNRADFERLALTGLAASPVGEILVERSIAGWKEFELEVMRDRVDNCVVVCSIENFDPMGVHTGDSVTSRRHRLCRTSSTRRCETPLSPASAAWGSRRAAPTSSSPSTPPRASGS